MLLVILMCFNPYEAQLCNKINSLYKSFLSYGRKGPEPLPYGKLNLPYKAKINWIALEDLHNLFILISNIFTYHIYKSPSLLVSSPTHRSLPGTCAHLTLDHLVCTQGPGDTIHQALAIPALPPLLQVPVLHVLAVHDGVGQPLHLVHASLGQPARLVTVPA